MAPEGSISMFTRTRQRFLSSARWVQFNSPNTIPLRSILILFSHQCRSLQSGVIFFRPFNKIFVRISYFPMLRPSFPRRQRPAFVSHSVRLISVGKKGTRTRELHAGFNKMKLNFTRLRCLHQWKVWFSLSECVRSVFRIHWTFEHS